MDTALQTLAEQSGFRQTGRLDEIESLCAAFVARWPEAVRSVDYGRSSQQRIMRALLVTRCGTLNEHALREREVPLLLLQAGIHPGESDGKDAGFIALRELLSAEAATSPLRQMAVLFVPAFNVDGHERVGRWNRPNQNGPEQTGWRATALNLNLNRDYTKADTPEMQAMLHLINEWDPLMCVDLHVTDGADFQPDVSIQVEPINQGDPQLRTSALAMRDRLLAALAAQGSMPLPFYPDFYKVDDPSSGFVLTVYSPRFSTGYFAQRNRFTLLVETHSWKPYAQRIRVTRNTIVALADLMARDGGQWLAQVRRADQEAAQLAGSQVSLDYKSGWREPGLAADTTAESAAVRTIDFPGYAYVRKRSAISGQLFTAYDPTAPQTWRVPYRDHIEPSVVVSVPRGGYIVPPAYVLEMGAKLRLHQIQWQSLRQTFPAQAVEVFRATRVRFSDAPFEGRMRATVEGEWAPETQELTAGSLFIPIEQTAARLLLTLLEPRAPDSLLAWGFFNACFEQKEYIEPYVAEQIARTMMDADSSLQQQFSQHLASDPAFAADPDARLEFFLRRHSSWDQQLNRYPIYRVEHSPQMP